jgi:hypothetical protein
MIDGGIVPPSADVLVEISHFHIELFAAAIAYGKISPVLIKKFAVDGRRIPYVEKDLVLDGCEETLRKCP